MKILDLVLVGSITSLIGSIMFKLFVNDNDESNNYLKDYKLIEIAFFVTGVVLHLILEYIGFNSQYCQKLNASFNG